ncbi:MAG TPA: phosphatidylglycerophosphatase A [Bacteroidota bacterium]|nr:phosphatidylglycerophosphatase A [Bacteroidota bacterium]
MSGSDQRTEPAERKEVPFAVRLLATGLYTGYIPWASGTFGSLAGLAVLLLPGTDARGVLPLMIAVGFFAGVYTSGLVARAEGNRLTRSAAAAKAMFQGAGHEQADPSIVVIDEIVGIWISLAGIAPGVLTYVAAFIFFRLFDVLKPEPARSLERLPGGWGIMLDDVVAGIYANAATRALLFLWALFAGGRGIL